MTRTGPTGADAIARALRDAGVDLAFGLPGVHNMALWPAFAAAGIRIVGSRHEQGCAYAADGYARATGRLGVALVTTGPGAANTLGAVGEAWASKSPVLVIATDIPSTQRVPGVYKGVLHETADQAALFAPVTKVQTHDLAGAISLALEPSRGPVYVEVPTDRLTAPAEPIVLRRRAMDRSGPPPLELGEAQRPLVWAGGGARDERAAIDALARHLGAPVITTFSARGVLPAGHPHLVPAPPHEPQVIELVEQADCTIVVGSDLDAMNTMAWKLPLPAPRIAINVDANDAQKSYAMDQVIATWAAKADFTIRGVEPRAPWFGDLTALGADVRKSLRADANTTESIEFLERTERALQQAGDPTVFADMCIPGYWLAGHYRTARVRGLHYPMGWGTLGWAFPAGVGAAAGGEPSVVVVGDGGMLFALGELAVVAQERLPLTVVVVDDGGYGMLRFPEARRDGTELAAVDFVQIAHAFGITADYVGAIGDEFEHRLVAAVASGAPRLLHVHAALYPPHTTSPRWPMK